MAELGVQDNATQPEQEKGSLEERFAQMEARLQRVELLEARLEQVERDQVHSFTIAQYNILASYLGNNTEPWFLYGCPSLTENKRKQILEQYERGRKEPEFRGFDNYSKCPPRPLSHTRN